MEKNKFQCPQCGAASSTKVSDTVYHCIYCESNFDVEPSREEMISNLFKTNSESRQKLADQIAAIRSGGTPEMKTAAKRRAFIVLGVIFGFLFLIGGIVFYNVRKQFKSTIAAANALVENSSINKFGVFSGSKGPVIWMLLEEEGSMTDSVHYLLRIINPQNQQTMKEIQFIPAMTWDDNFDASKFIGTFYPFGDTCWITSEHDVLYARDIYSGKIISTVNMLGNKFPEFSKGITKVDWGYSNKIFYVTSNDGFDFVYAPDVKKVFKKEDWDNRDNKNADAVTKTFFILTDGKRPELFKSVEKTSPFATSSKTFSSDLEKYDPKKRPWGLSDDVISITPLLPDKTFFNGSVEYSDNDKAIVMYQNSIAKKSALHISCISADGKTVWDISGNEVKSFIDIFSDNNHGVDFIYSPTAVILYEEYGDHNAIGLDWKTGKVLWSFSTEKKK
jgi:hypothetical protein